MTRTSFWIALRWALCSLWLGLCLNPSAHAVPAKAARGHIDLSALDVSHREMASLDGEWAFYWGQLLTPADLATGKTPPDVAYLQVPSTWSKTSFRGKPLPSMGYASYHLLIQPPPGRHELALRLDEITSASKLWINGVQVFENGVVGRDKASETPKSSLQIVKFTNQGEPIELLLQISNFHRWTATLPSIQFSSAKTIELNQDRSVSAAVLLIGGMLVMCLYHLALFFMRKKEWASLYFSLYCLIRIDYAVFNSASDGVVRLIFPDISSHTIYAGIMIGLYLTPAISLAFFRSLYPQEFSRRVLNVSIVVSAGLLLINAIYQFELLPRVQLFFYAFSLALIAYYIYCLCKAWRAKRVGAGLILIGYLFLAATLANDIMMDMKVIYTFWLIPEGMFIFVLFQSFALARRFTMAFASVEKLTGTLEERNGELRQEITERIRLEHEIEQVSEKERRAISRELHDGLCQQLTAARLHCSVLRLDCQESGSIHAGIEKMASLLHGAVNHAYALSRGLWPVEQEERDLVISLGELVSKTRQDQQINISLRSQLSCECCRNANATTIYYIAKEALQNICKHANAHHVEVLLDCHSTESQLILRIEDDGVGLKTPRVSPGGLGIRIMTHRARSIGAELSVSDRDTGGTVVSLNVPCATRGGTLIKRFKHV